MKILNRMDHRIVPWNISELALPIPKKEQPTFTHRHRSSK